MDPSKGIHAQRRTRGVQNNVFPQFIEIRTRGAASDQGALSGHSRAPARYNSLCFDSPNLDVIGMSACRHVNARPFLFPAHPPSPNQPMVSPRSPESMPIPRIPSGCTRVPVIGSTQRLRSLLTARNNNNVCEPFFALGQRPLQYTCSLLTCVDSLCDSLASWNACRRPLG